MQYTETVGADWSGYDSWKGCRNQCVLETKTEHQELNGNRASGSGRRHAEGVMELYLIQEQGYDMSHTLIYQDNKSSMLLEVNGKILSSKRAKDIKSKYFFVTDKVAKGEVVIEHKPTKEMWIDVNTKPK